jgi:5'-nucleotidase/UDP-sugar diphosphatase
MRHLTASVLGLWLWTLTALGGDGPLTILHFNDFHGQLPTYQPGEGASGQGGIARLGAAVAAIRAEDPGRPVLLLFAGDLLQGTQLSTLFHGLPDVQLFNTIGVDAAVLGNHELDYGQDNLVTLLGEARYPVLSANVDIPPAREYLLPATVLTLANGVRVGLLGLTTPELITATHPRNSAGVSVRDPLAEARERLPELDAASDLLVVLSHLGLEGDRQLASHQGGLDLVVGGHNHFTLEQPQRENGVLIVQAGERGRWLGRLDLQVRDDRAELLNYTLLPLSADRPEDPAIAARVATLNGLVSAELERVVGETAVPLGGAREAIRRGESNLGNLVADLAIAASGARVALLNGGGFRDSIPAGPVTLGQIQAVFPFGNTLVRGRLSGARLLAALQRSAGLNPLDNPGGFLQVGGLRLGIRDGRAVEVTLADGTPLDPAAEYTLVTSDFLAAGGDGYAMLQNLEDATDTGHRLSDLLVEAFAGDAPLTAATDGRIRRLP